MARSRYQSANKELGEMYEHELEQTAEEIDATIDELIAESNALMSTNAALRAELARVKAESLRVVVEGEPCEYWRKRPGFCLNGKRVHGNSPDIVGKFDMVQPVRLERWEDE